MPSLPLTAALCGVLAQRRLSEGGFADRPGSRYRADATAWGIMALAACDGHQGLDLHRGRLAQDQGSDGRILLSPSHPDGQWPTALAILAWTGAPAYHVPRQQALQFLVDTTGNHYPKKPDDPLAHDTTLRGWPWIMGTHSWIEPTALALLALKASGQTRHPRVLEAVRMVLNRQLPHGGWNYGNTLVFGRELRPMPESTGAAVTGLAGVIEENQVAKSLSYLQDEVDRLRTPISLGWALLGLAAWGRRPSNSPELVARCVANQSRYGEYDTSSLCLLLLGGVAGESDARIALLPQAREASVLTP